MFGKLIGIIALIAMVWVIADVLLNQRRMKAVEKVLWIICAVIFSIITAAVYYFLKKR